MRLAIPFLLALTCLRGETVKEILDRMDADAATFRGLTAKVKRIEFTAPPLSETTQSDGEMTLFKGRKGITALVDFQGEDAKEYLFKDGQLQEYLPKLNIINEYNMGKSASVVNQFVTLGFGSSGKELQASYSIEQKGTEVLKVGDQEVKTTKLELVPRAPDALKMMKKIEFWIPEGKSYAAQLKIYQPSGNWDTAIYSNLQINPPSLNEHAVELKAPKNAHHEKMNK